jgi:hypothetical protein
MLDAILLGSGLLVKSGAKRNSRKSEGLMADEDAGRASGGEPGRDIPGVDQYCAERMALPATGL